MNSETVYEKKTASTLPRLFVVLSGALLLAGGLHLMFASPLWPGYSPPTADPIRGAVLALAMVISTLRILFTLFYLLRRSMNWEEAMGIPFAFILYFLFFGALVRFNQEPVGWLEWMGLGLFLFGSSLNTGSELARHIWKKHPENKGKLYTTGPFALARHINYTGDIIWVAGMACITGSIYSAIVVILVFCFFAFFNGPMLDRYLARKYGAQYDAWAKKTRSLIPGLF